MKKNIEIDFSQIHCQCDYILDDGHEEVRYCHSVAKVQTCVDLARNVQSIINEKDSTA